MSNESDHCEVLMLIYRISWNCGIVDLVVQEIYELFICECVQLATERIQKRNKQQCFFFDVKRRKKYVFRRSDLANVEKL